MLGYFVRELQRPVLPYNDILEILLFQHDEKIPKSV